MDHSTTVSTSLRKDDAIVSNIINQLTSGRYEDTDDFCSETKASKERIIARARLALSDTAIDRDDLHHQFTMLIRMIDLERRATTMAESLQRYRYFVDAGDWAAGIVNIAKSVEKTAKGAHHVQLQTHLKATGSSADEAAKMVKKFDDWLILKGSQATDCWVILKGELDRIRSWFLAGRPAGKEPESPGLVCVFICYFHFVAPAMRERDCSLTQALLVP